MENVVFTDREGCSYGNQSRMMIEAIRDNMEDTKDIFEKFRSKLDLIIYIIIVLSFMAGADVITRFIGIIK